MPETNFITRLSYFTHLPQDFYFKVKKLFAGLVPKDQAEVIKPLEDANEYYKEQADLDYKFRSDQLNLVTEFEQKLKRVELDQAEADQQEADSAALDDLTDKLS